MTFDDTDQPGGPYSSPDQAAPRNPNYQQGSHPSAPTNYPGYQQNNAPSFPGQAPNSGPGHQYQQNNAPSFPGQAPNSGPGYQYQQNNPTSFPGQAPNSGPGYQYRQNNPSSFPGQAPNTTPAFPGQMSNSNPNFSPAQSSSGNSGPMAAGVLSSQGGQNAPASTANDVKAAGVPRRNMLKMSALVGSSLVVGAGAALGGQQIITHALPSSSNSSQATSATQGPTNGQVREYWVQADSFHHNLIPTGKDNMMGMTFKPTDAVFWAIGYRAYTPNWGKPLAGSDDIGPNTGIPGPVFRGSVGDTIRVHFRNNDTHYNLPHSMHPHGVLYTPENDGAYIASDPQPGAMVAPGQSYTYEWQVHPNSVGTWVYHDHSVSYTVKGNMMMEFGAEVGLFGFLVLTDSSTKPATKEFFTFLHDVYQADLSSLAQDFDCFNGYSYLGNTPVFQAKVGDTIRWHIGALGKEFHAFHLHGHRWTSNGQFVDVVQLGPSNALSFDFVADNPGKWLYHCHVTDHMMGGMMGMYIISA